MPEGPSIVILKEQVQLFTGKLVLEAGGNSKNFPFDLFIRKKVLAFKSWGKHFLICFEHATIRIHLLMFGSYRINEQKDASPRLYLRFSNGELIFYNCSVKLFYEHPDEVYDWTADVMNDTWDAANAKRKLLAHPDMLVCDALLDQTIFSGVGNIIKNEVLFRIRVHPESLTGALPTAKLNALVKEARVYSFEFLEWKKNYELKQHWLAHTKRICPRCNIPFSKQHLGKTHRRTFFCTNCQIMYI